ncbi:hypothetical protein ERW49_12285 [Aliivibrio finisterrensis]|uniref:Uncharacterized protein n=1 Tax=Aliivibrio finisterrensis TaxID=511998 RepID=A0A4V1Z7L7_9GAMM|nr:MULTISPECIES: hypothetical protein [Aliivibrio]MDD9176197.1 hypothetical protein [Aliivibrio sp. S3TY1]MDD9193195.1 hypothetical protein [Aliivibrio sp. S2TY2]RYU45767.1 hypothetical protein ERW49_12285 [Aliivibrio finisterrensis]
MKISKLIQNLQDIQASSDDDLEVVTGEEWFPEQLLNTSVNHNMTFLHFDRMPSDIPAEIDARGFLEHEEVLIKKLINNVIFSELEPEDIVNKLTSMLIFSHENISSDVIEHFSETEK